MSKNLAQCDITHKKLAEDNFASLSFTTKLKRPDPWGVANQSQCVRAPAK
jgi:hypothetical protein